MTGRNRTRYAVLGALSQHPMSGYDVKCVLETIVGHFWHESFGQIYPILRQLVTEGLATVEPQPGPGRANRLVYTVTAAGRLELDRWLAEPVEQPQRPRHELLLKLFFGAGLAPEATLGMIERHRQETEALLETYAGIDVSLRDEAVAGNAGQPFWLATLRYGQLQAEATLRWCEETAALVRRLAEPAAGPDAASRPPAVGSDR